MRSETRPERQGCATSEASREAGPGRNPEKLGDARRVLAERPGQFPRCRVSVICRCEFSSGDLGGWTRTSVRERPAASPSHSVRLCASVRGQLEGRAGGRAPGRPGRNVLLRIEDAGLEGVFFRSPGLNSFYEARRNLHPYHERP